MQELNINKLNDGDLVIYEDLDVEFKHNSNKVHSSPSMCTNHRLPYGTKLKTFTHKVTMGSVYIKCFVVKTTDDDFEYWSTIPNCTPYGYDNKPGE